MATVDTKVGEGHYSTLSDADLLSTYRDQLRGKETDHARRVQAPEDYGPSYDQYIATLEEQIVRLRKKVADYEQRIDVPAP